MEKDVGDGGKKEIGQTRQGRPQAWQGPGSHSDERKPLEEFLRNKSDLNYF